MIRVSFGRAVVVGTSPCKAECFQTLGLCPVGVTLFVVKYLRSLLGFFKVSTRR